MSTKPIAFMKSARRILLCSTALLAVTGSSALAQSFCSDGVEFAGNGECNLGAFNPLANGNQAGKVVAGGGGAVTLTGSGENIVAGTTGVRLISFSELYRSERTSSPYANPDNTLCLVINSGSQSKIILVPDLISGGTRAVSVFDNGNIVDTYADKVRNNYAFSTHSAVDGRQYIDVRVGKVSSGGGVLEVMIGDASLSVDSPENYLNFGMVKQSDLFYVDGTGGVDSSLVWRGKNYITFGSVTGEMDPDSGNFSSQDREFNSYHENGFLVFDGSLHFVTDDSSVASV